MCRHRKAQSLPSYTELIDEKTKTVPDYEVFDTRAKLAEARRKYEEDETLYHKRELRCAEMLVAIELQYGTEFVQRNMVDILVYVEMYRFEMKNASKATLPYTNSIKMRAKLDEIFASYTRT